MMQLFQGEKQINKSSKYESALERSSIFNKPSGKHSKCPLKSLLKMEIPNLTIPKIK